MTSGAMSAVDSSGEGASSEADASKSTVLSSSEKGESSGAQEWTVERVERSEKILKAIKAHVFLSVMEHCISLQSEPLLITKLCGGDAAAAMRILANSQGLVGVLSLIINQAGGRISDATGRKTGLLVGPLLNIVLGAFAFGNPSSRQAIVVCRILRMIVTTFSNTVMVQASLLDALPGWRIGGAFAELGACIGGGVVLTPLLESLILKATNNNPRYSYLALSALAGVHFAYTGTYLLEPLAIEQRKSMKELMSLQTLNPFGFIKVFTRGSSALQRMVGITTLQMFLEGKNLSDLSQTWMFQNLHWRPEHARNFSVAYGVLCILAGTKLTPYLLKKLSARSFTSATNFTNGLAFAMRGALPKSSFWMLAVLPMLPGVNGASANALKAILGRRAEAEGFGGGEFSAYSNNLRSLAGAAAVVVYGNVYAWARRRGVLPGSAFFVAAAMGAILPQALLHTLRDEDLAVDEPHIN